MLTINLLPHTKKTPTSNRRKQVLLLVLVGVFLGAGLIQSRQMLTAQVNRLSQEKSSKSSTLSKLQEQLIQIKDFKKKGQELETRIHIIRKIRRQQALPVRYLDEIAKYTPREKLWFESLRMDDQGGITLSGIALDNQVFARYLQKLRQSPFISDVSLQQTQRKEIQGLHLVAFRCSLLAASEHPEPGENHG